MRRTGLVLWHKPNSVPAFARWRSFISLGFPSAQHYYRVLVALCRPFLKPDNSAGCDYYPRVSSRIRGKSGQATLPLLCLAPHGVFRAAPLTRTPGGLLPRLFTLTQHWMVLGGIFSVTLSVTRDSRPGRPRFHGACCLSVFGLSSGKTSVKPAITRHDRENSTERGRVLVSDLMLMRMGDGCLHLFWCFCRATIGAGAPEMPIGTC